MRVRKSWYAPWAFRSEPCRDRVNYRRAAHWAIVLGLLVAPVLHAEEEDQENTKDESPPKGRAKYVEKYEHLSFEELMKVDVTSVAGVEQEWFKSPAAIYVITGEEARRSGHRMLADTLRLAPGVFVGTVNSHARTVGTRGFNGGLANKTLVLIDGRSVYDPLFSGTFWDVQDVLVEDLDRIEVIRGPGPTLWGANAVNGVINVTTKSSKYTQGLYASGGGGNEEHAFGEMRYGGQLADNAWFRVWGKWYDRDDLIIAGNTAHDDWDMAIGGARFDFEDDEGGKLMIDAATYESDRLGEATSVPIFGAFPPASRVEIDDGWVSGGHFIARYAKELDDGSGWSLQAYYDRTNRVQAADFKAERDTFDTEFRHHFKLGESNELLWGAGYRYTTDRTTPSVGLSMDPEDRSVDTFSAFVQDTHTLIPDTLFAMAGVKIEHNDFSGFEYQPSGRLWWTPTDRQTFWGSVTRAVRVPSRFEQDSTITLAFFGPVPIAVTGDEDVRSEELIAYEIGHRIMLSPSLSVDTTLFYNDYQKLITVPATIIGSFNNDGTGESYGGELTVTWQAAENWRTVFGYSFSEVEIHGPVFNVDEGNTPQNMAQVRSYLDITKDIELNAGLYYVDTIEAVDADPYLRLDVGMTWRITEHFELAAWGQNLLDPEHREFTGVEAQRGFYVMGTIRY